MSSTRVLLPPVRAESSRKELADKLVREVIAQYEISPRVVRQAQLLYHRLMCLRPEPRDVYLALSRDDDEPGIMLLYQAPFSKNDFDCVMAHHKKDCKKRKFRPLQVDMWPYTSQVALLDYKWVLSLPLDYR